MMPHFAFHHRATITNRLLIVLFIVVLPSALAATLVPSADLAVGDRNAHAVVSTEPLRPVVAATGDIHLIVFVVEGNVWAVRAGIDERPFLIFAAETAASTPSVAAAEDRFLVVYSTSTMVEAAFVDFDGRVTPVGVISGSPAHSTAVAFDGVHFLAVLGRRAVLLDHEAELVRQIDLLPGLGTTGLVTSVTTDGIRFLVTLGQPLQVVILSSAGDLLSTMALEGGSAVSSFDGSRFLVVWTLPAGASSVPTVAGLYLERSGQPSSETFTIASWAFAPRITSTAEGTLVLWQTHPFYFGRVEAMRLDRGGNRIDPAPIEVAAKQSETEQLQQVTAGPAGTLIVTERRSELRPFRGFEYSLSSVFLDSSLKPTRILDPVAIAPRPQREPAIASNGRMTVIAWTEMLLEEHRYAVLAARVTPDGVILDPDGIRMPGDENQVLPAVALSDDGALIVMRSGDSDILDATATLRAVRLSFDGHVSPPIDIPLAQRGSFGFPITISVASNGSSFLIVWSELGVRGRFPFMETRSACISADGELIDRETQLLGPMQRPRLAAWGENFVVSSRFGSSILLDLLDSEGRKIRRLFELGPGFDPIHATAVGGDRLLLTWPGRSQADDGSVRIHGTLLDLESSFLVPSRGRTRPVAIPRRPKVFEISSGSAHASNPSVSHDGVRFLVAWRESDDHPHFPGGEILGRLVSEEGHLIGNVFTMVDTPYGDAMPVVSGASGRFVLGYQRVAPDLGLGPSSRVFIRLLESARRGRPVRSAAD